MKKAPKIINLAYLEFLVRKQEQKEEQMKKMDNYIIINQPTLTNI
jgi:hypothetical protein